MTLDKEALARTIVEKIEATRAAGMAGFYARQVPEGLNYTEYWPIMAAIAVFEDALEPDERHRGYQQLHALVRHAPAGVQRAVGNEQQRVLANGSFALHPNMLLHLLTRAYEEGTRA